MKCHKFHSAHPTPTSDWKLDKRKGRAERWIDEEFFEAVQRCSIADFSRGSFRGWGLKKNKALSPKGSQFGVGDGEQT